MEEIIERASRRGATVASVLLLTNSCTGSSSEQLPEVAIGDFLVSSTSSAPSTQPQRIWISNEHESTLYFQAIPTVVGRGAVGLLVSASEYVSSEQASTKQCFQYLQAVSFHMNALAESNNISSEQKYVTEIVTSAGIAATRCQRRCDVAQSGIIQALEQLSLRINAAVHADKQFTSLQQQQQKKSFVLSPAYVEFLQTCLSAGHYYYANQFIDTHEIFSILVKISSEHYLRYFYLVGMIRLGCRRFRDALRSFTNCITVPSQVISAITIAARKKHLLIKCLLLALNQHHEDLFIKEADSDPSSSESLTKKKSSFFDLPPSTSPSVYKFLVDAESSQISTEDAQAELINSDQDVNFGLQYYHQLVQVFLDINSTEFQSLLNQSQNLLRTDGNLGLVRQLNDLLPSRKLVQIAKIYETISISKLQQKLCLETQEQVEALLISVLASFSHNGQPKPTYPFNAKIDHEQQIVYFYQSSEPKCVMTQQEHDELISHIHACMELSDKIRDLDVQLASSKKFQSVLSMKESSSGISGGATL